MLVKDGIKLCVILFTTFVLSACDLNTYENESNIFAENQGKRLYEGRCASCHGINGQGKGTPLTPAIDPSRSSYNQLSLEVYIEQNMQRGGVCLDDCARKVAEYVRTFSVPEKNEEPTPPDDTRDPETLTGDAGTGATL
ncbi:MAG: cytochrome c, partial [Reinekea sp.]|nr:cytochrome c [Reinekea sp.]